MMRLLTVAALASLPATLPVASLPAQQPIVLHDEDVARLVPVIGATYQETARRRESVSAIMTDYAAAEQFAADVEAGRVDLEAVLRQHAPHASAPANARYDAPCSRSMVLPGSSGGVRGTFALAYRLPAETSNGSVTRAVAHYRGRGFATSERGSVTTWLEWPNTAADSLVVGVGRIFRSDDGAPGCRHLVDTPVVVLRLPSFAITTNARAAAPATNGAIAATAVTRTRVQSRAGMSSQQIDELIGAAMIARADAANGEELDGLATLASEMADFRPQVDARRRNVAWYRRHKPALEPALGRYVDQIAKH